MKASEPAIDCRSPVANVLRNDYGFTNLQDKIFAGRGLQDWAVDCQVAKQWMGLGSFCRWGEGLEELKNGFGADTN